MATFADVYNAVLLRCPGTDPLLVRDWVAETYQVACDDRTWSHQRAETAIQVANQKSGTATITQGTTTLTGVGITFAATDVGRQVRLSSIPIYTITAVNVGLNTATLDRAYSETTATAQTFYVLDAYWTAPLDFWRFLAVLDPTNKWRLRWWVTEDQLNAIDPGRMSTGSAWCLASQRYSPVTADAGKARYELFPYVTSARSYVVCYYTKPTVLTEDDTLIGPFARAKDVLVEGALARCSLWPGTQDKRNPYFNLHLADKLEARFRARLQNLENKDEDLYPVNMPSAQYWPWAPWPLDSTWLQSHVPETIDTAY